MQTSRSPSAASISSCASSPCGSPLDVEDDAPSPKRPKKMIRAADSSDDEALDVDDTRRSTPSPKKAKLSREVSSEDETPEVGDKQRTATQRVPAKPLRSFLIDDILSHNATRSQHPCSTRSLYDNNNKQLDSPPSLANSFPKIVRPWDVAGHARPAHHTTSHSMSPPANGFSGPHHHAFLRQSNNRSPQLHPGLRPRSADEDTCSDASSDIQPDSPAPRNSNNTINSPLDALFELANKSFDDTEKCRDGSSDHLNLFSNRQPPKKKRKSRTAFTNHQIFELEKRFLYQKYLSPADRDELASTLGLTGAQVITWFQNRRAKLKRDMEELKKDMETAKLTGAMPVRKNPMDYGAGLDYNMLKPSDLSLHALHAVRK